MFHEESLPDEAFIKRDILCLNPKHVRPYLFKTNDVEGRYLIASRDIKAGEAILREVPLSKGPQFSTKPVCLTCYKWTNGKYVCKKCGWPLCGPDCQKNPGDHDIECKIFQQKSVKVDSSTFKFSSGGEPLYDVIPPIRALALRDKDPESWKLFFNLMSHCDNWMTDPEWKKSHQYIIDYILNTLKIENVTEKMILTLFGIFYTNDFSTRIDNGQSPDNQPIGFTKLRLCFALISICSHDCVPNAIYDIVKEGDPAEFNIILKAKNNIKTGEKILISYVDILLPTYIRQKTLLESKKFLCQCERCKDPTSLGTYGDALLCQKCKFDQKNNKGVLLKSNTGIRKCNQCDWEQAESDIESILDAIHREADLLLNNPKLNQVDLFEKFIKKHQKTLHPNHMFLCLVKYSLSGFYGRLPGYEMHEMTPETVSRKQQICEETLKVIEKIEPGVGVRKGMLMYELHMPLIMMTQMKYQSGSVDKDSAKKNFKKAIKYLKEALDILKLEPEGTFEKNVYHGAKNSIEPLQNFVNSI